MHKVGSFEGITEMTLLSISCNKSCEPIISDTNSWDDLSLTAILKASFTKSSNLLDSKLWCYIRIWDWEDVTVVHEDKLNTFNRTLMDSESNSTINIDFDVVNIVNSISLDVSSSTLSISFIVWGDNNDLLTKLSNTD